MSKPNYGLDAPNVIRNLVLGAVAAFILAAIGTIKIGSVIIETSGFIWSGACIFLGALWMIAYSKYGKLKHRDRMLNFINWTGNEQVLDIGTGLGLLMIGAAKKLSTGKSIGIDIWNAEDLTSNNVTNALNNAAAENVSDKVEILNENAMQMSFADNTFDVILSNECIHNIYNREGRAKACAEIARVLKPGGKAIISDHVHVKEYQLNFDKLGLSTQMNNPYYIGAYPTLRVLQVTKTAMSTVDAN